MTKILAIEDEKVILDNIMEILEVAGMDVHGALDGVEGVQMAHDLLPDVILCDINMPEIDGYSVLMELRSDPTTALIPFIFLTAYVDKPFQRKGMNLGAADYLTKPFTARDLLETIEAQVGKRDQHDKLRTTEMEALRSSIVLALPHELRTPLTGIITCADMLLMDFDEGVTPEPQRTEQMVRIIHRSGQRLQRLVENYLVYSQIEIYTNNPDSPPNLRLGEGITNPIQVVEKAGAQVAIEQQREGDLHIGDLLEARVQVSERNLHKIVTEIADNAFKFSKPGTPVHITGEMRDGMFGLHIIDQGRGMTPEQIQKVGAYMQFDRHLHEQQGVGMGLTIAKRLTEIHKGKLEISSQNNGTQVSLWFWLLDEA